MLEKRLLFFIILLSVLVRLLQWDYPVGNGEPHREYLIGRHIVKEGELILTGYCCVFNGAFGNLRHGPFYHYLTGALTFISDDILFLNLLNIILQIVNLLIVYFLAKLLFGQSTALVTLILYSFSFQILRQSQFYWQPHLANPFLNLSLLLIALSYFKKKIKLLFSGTLLFSLAAALHSSVYGLLPALFLLVLFVIKKFKQPVTLFLKIFSVFFISQIIFYLPYLFYILSFNKKAEFLYFLSGKILVSTASLLSNFLTNSNTLWHAFFIPQEKNLLPYLLSFIVILLSLFYPRVKPASNTHQKKYFLILILTITQFLLLASFFNAKIWSFYLTPIFSIFIIVMAEVINTVLSKRPILNLGKILLTVLLVTTFSANFKLIIGKVPLQESKNINLAISAVKNEVLDIQKKEKSDLHFFSLKVYSPYVESPVTTDMVFWSLLEKKLSRKFISVAKDSSYKVVNTDRYLFLICQSYLGKIKEQEECLAPFSEQFAGHQILKKIYSREPFSIFMAKKIS